MKKLVRCLSAMVAAVLCVGMMSLSVAAASTKENASTPEAARPAASASQTSSKAADVSGSYHAPSIAKAAEKVKGTAFLAPTVYIDPVTRAISNVYDADGNLIPATLSSDGHFYIVPTNEGYLFIGTGF